MNSYLDLVKEYERVHKKKNRITLICIAISVFLVTTIFGMADMELRAQRIRQINESGNWHVSYKDISEEKTKLIAARPEVKFASWMASVGGKAGYTLDGKLLCAGAIDKEMAGAFSVFVLEGTYPQKTNEVLVNHSAKESLHLSVGDSFAIQTPNNQERVFIVSGFTNDTSSLLVADGYGILLTPNGLRTNFSQEVYKERFAVQFDTHSNMRHVIDDIAEKLSVPVEQTQENIALLGVIGQSRNNYMMQLYGTAAVLFVLVLVAGVLMIASSFNMNIMERIQFFGMLRCLGASKAQVKRFVLLEGLRYCLKGVPIGLITATGVVWILCVFLKFVNPSYFSAMPFFGISWISLLCGAIIGVLTVIVASFSPCRKAAKVSPLCAINGNINQATLPQFKSGAKTSHKKVEIALGMHHAYSDKKNLLLMTGSFAISILLFLSFSVAVDFMHHAIKSLKPWTPDLSIVSMDNTYSIETGLLQKISENPQIKRIYGRMFAYDVPVTAGETKGQINLISYEENQFRWAKDQLTEGNIEQVETATDKVLVVYSSDSTWKTGDSIMLQLPIGSKKVIISGVLSSSPFDHVQGTETVICSEDTFRSLTGTKGYTVLDMQLKKGTTNEAVSEIHSLAEGIQFSDRRAKNTEAKAAYLSFSVFIYGFLVVIASITVFNIMNSMNMSILGRINQYGAMLAIGMSGQQLKRMVTAEAATYAVSGCLTGCLLGLPLHKALYENMITYKWGEVWTIPVFVLSIIIALVLATTFLSVIAPIRKIRGMDIVNTINAQ